MPTSPMKKALLAGAAYFVAFIFLAPYLKMLITALTPGDFLANIVLEQPLEFLRSRWPLPGPAERVNQIFLLATADIDLVIRAAFAGNSFVKQEYGHTQQQEMQQRLPQEREEGLRSLSFASLLQQKACRRA